MTDQDLMKLALEHYVESLGFLTVLDALRDVCAENQAEAEERKKTRLAILWMNRYDALRHAEHVGA